MTEQTERLLQLAEFLDALPEEQFDISAWVSHVGTSLGQSGRPHVGCGTVACAMGWAPAVFPELRYSGRFCLNGERMNGYEVAQRLFEITMSTVHWLFWGGSYQDEHEVQPSDVATRIYRLVSTGETFHAPHH